MPDDTYPPESIRVLAGMERPVRDPDDPRVRWCREFLDDPREPLLPVTSPRVQQALEQIMRDTGFSEDMIRRRFPEPPSDRPSRTGERAAIGVEDLTDAEMAMIMAAEPVGPDYSLDEVIEMVRGAPDVPPEPGDELPDD